MALNSIFDSNSMSEQQIKQITVGQFFEAWKDRLKLSVVAENDGMARPIREPTVNRPGLLLAGFTQYFASKRIQVFGSAESTYLRSLDSQTRLDRYRLFFRRSIPCVVFGRNLKPDPAFLEEAARRGVPVFRSPLITMNFMNSATLALESQFAPRGSEMGSMVDIQGVGVIIKGDSGVGKSECVLALIERGYSLVADDITKVILIGGDQVIGTSAEITRDHLEVRGLGIINVARMFGVKSIRLDKRVDLIVHLKEWGNVNEMERVGMEEMTQEILGVKIPYVTIPVGPGRDIARLVEVAAFQNKLREAGFNSAEEFNRRLIEFMNHNSKKSGGA